MAIWSCHLHCQLCFVSLPPLAYVCPFACSQEPSGGDRIYCCGCEVRLHNTLDRKEYRAQSGTLALVILLQLMALYGYEFVSTQIKWTSVFLVGRTRVQEVQVRPEDGGMRYSASWTSHVVQNAQGVHTLLHNESIRVKRIVSQPGVHPTDRPPLPWVDFKYLAQSECGCHTRGLSASSRICSGDRVVFDHTHPVTHAVVHSVVTAVMFPSMF